MASTCPTCDKPLYCDCAAERRAGLRPQDRLPEPIADAVCASGDGEPLIITAIDYRGLRLAEVEVHNVDSVTTVLLTPQEAIRVGSALAAWGHREVGRG